MRTIFMGTPEIAAVILKSLLEHQFDIIAVVTQPDKPKGRGKEMAFPDVKKVALEYNLPVYQPQKAKDVNFIQQMRELNPDIIIVAAFGQLLTKELLDIPPMGCINVHASLLPKYRGAAPIQQVILDGEEKTGVTIMRMDVGLDTGDMIYKEEVLIAPKETAGSLHDKLAVTGSHALLTALDMIQNHTAVYEKQDNSQSSYFGQFTKEFGNLDFNQPAVVLERKVRGLNPWPSAYTKLDGKTLKIWDVDVLSDYKDKVSINGTITEIRKDSFIIKTGEGALIVKELQLEGKKRMSAGDFLRGYALTTGTVLGR